MRIVCQKCSAAYAIDDKFVTPKGVRAQCPRCRHLQLVKREAEAAPADASPFAAPGDSPFGPPTGPSPFEPMPQPGAVPPSPFGSGGSSDLFDLSSPVSATSPGMPGPSAADSRELMDFSELGPPPAAPVPPAAPAPQASPFGGFGDDLFGSVGSQAALAPLSTAAPEPRAFGASPQVAPAPAADAGPEARCRSCGKPIFDPFDQALEICDDCRNKPEASTGPTLEVQARPPSSGSRPVAPAAAPAGDAGGPTSAHSGLTPPQPYRLQTAMIAPPSSGPGKWVGVGLVVAALLGVGGWAVVKRPWVKKPPPLAKRAPGADAPIDAMVQEWRLRFPDLSGSAAEFLAQGEEQLARDTTQGYARAEEAFQRALVLDSKNDRAIAGWALALAFGHHGAIEERTGKAAEALLTTSEQRSGDPRVYIAHAHLLLARAGNFNDIEVLAKRGLSSASDKDKALANLALGQAYLTKNPTFAADYFGQAAKLDSKLKRALLYQAQLLVQQGELRRAMDSVEKRLTADPDQWEAADMLARLYLEAGEVAKARQTYELVRANSGKDARAQLTLAVLAYQHEGQPRAAIKALEALLADEDALDAQDLVSALGHLAAAKRVAGDAEGAAAAADRALDKSAGDLNAAVQRFLVAIEKSRPQDARAQLQKISGRLGDAALEGVFAGLVELAEGRAPEAHKLFVKAYETDKRRTDALLLAGAAAARAHLDGKAWEYALKRGLAADPWRAAPRAVMAPVFVRPADVLGSARGAFAPLGRDAEDPNPPLAEGLVAWFADDLDAADREFGSVVRFDPSNSPGLAYRSLIALRRGQIAQASKLAARAVGADRVQPLAHAALGVALLAENKLEPAKKALTRASELAPAMLLPRVKIGEIDGRQKRTEASRTALTTVLLSDPLYREARRAQYLGGS